jgi:hypothetical protein
MKCEDIPAPREGVIVTHFLVVRDQDTSREGTATCWEQTSSTNATH